MSTVLERSRIQLPTSEPGPRPPRRGPARRSGARGFGAWLASWSRRLLDLGLRESRGDWSRHDPAFIDSIWAHLDRGTFEAILRLYRSAPPDRLAAAGERLASITAPSLVVWGVRDRYIPARFGRAYAERLPNAELLELPRAGHWPWIDAPEVVDRVIRFLATEEDFPNT